MENRRFALTSGYHCAVPANRTTPEHRFEQSSPAEPRAREEQADALRENAGTPREQADAPVTVPHTELGAESLRAVIESFVLREGTDYGETELSLDAKAGRVMRQLERGEAHIVYDPASESVAIVTASASSRRSR